MKSYDAEHVFNVALVSHGGAGKTSLTEAMLYRAGAITRLGSVEEGNTTSDFDPDEIKTLYTCGYELGRAGYSWATEPPGLTAKPVTGGAAVTKSIW